MNYRQMLYLDVVVQYGSINRAAKALQVSQPNLSRAISKLEEEIGYPLLERDLKGTVLTQEGKRFYNLSHDIVRKTKALTQAYQRSPTQAFLSFHLATFPQRITQVVVKELVEAFEKEECYQIVVWNLGMKELLDMVRKYRCELGIVFLTPGESENYMRIIEENGLEYHEVSATRPCVNLSMHNPLYWRRSLSLVDLEPYPMVRHIEDDISYLDYRVVDFTRFSKSVFFNNDEAILTLVSQTEAFKIGYSWTEEEFQKLGVRCIPLKEDIGLLHLGWVCRREGGLSKTATQFIRLFEQRYGA